MTALLRTELYKQARRVRTYVAYSIVVVIPVVLTVAVHANPPDRPEGRGGLFFLATHTGLVVPAAALRLTSTLPLLAIIVALFGGDAIAGEASWGNLRYVLVRPIARGRLIAAKLAVSILLAWIGVVLVVLAGLAAGVVAFGWHGLDLPFRLLVQSPSQLVGHLALATVYVAWGLTGALAFAFMISTMTDAAAGAIGAGVGLYITSQILDSIDPLGNIRYGLPTHYLDAWVDMFTRGTISSDMLRGALLQLGYVVVFTTVAAWWFRRKDVLS